MTALLDGLVALLMLSGLFFAFASVVGVIRFPDVYTRLHASTKALSGGALLILLGTALKAALLGNGPATVKILLIAAFLLATNPLASHAIARACYRHGIVPRGTVDDYGKSLKGDRP